MIVELDRSWQSYGTADIRLLVFNENGALLKDMDLVPPLNTHVKNFHYMIAGHGNYVLLAQAWEDGDGIRYLVISIDIDTDELNVLDRGYLENVYTLVLSRIYELDGGDQYLAIYYLKENGTLIFKAYSPMGMIYKFERRLPFQIVNGINYVCCAPQKITFSSLAYDRGGFYIPLSLEVSDNGNDEWVNVLVGKRDVYVFDTKRESWGMSLARVSSWNKVIVGGNAYFGTGYGYVLPDPGDPISFPEIMVDFAGFPNSPIAWGGGYPGVTEERNNTIIIIAPTLVQRNSTIISNVTTFEVIKYLRDMKGIPAPALVAVLFAAWRKRRARMKRLKNKVA